MPPTRANPPHHLDRYRRDLSRADFLSTSLGTDLDITRLPVSSSTSPSPHTEFGRYAYAIIRFHTQNRLFTPENVFPTASIPTNVHSAKFATPSPQFDPQYSLYPISRESALVVY